jgi:hypothetical protein
MDQFYENASLPSDFDVAIDAAGAGLGDAITSAFSDAVTDALADPMIRAVMSADRVDPRALETMLRRVARTVTPQRSAGNGLATAGCGYRS